MGWGGVGWGIGKRVKRRNVFFLYYIERTVSLLYYIVSNEIYSKNKKNNPSSVWNLL